jgi:hypothetical protein
MISQTKFLIIIIALSSFNVFACRNVDRSTKETIIMYDLNYIFQEVEAARKAACEKGKKFIVLPHGYETHKKNGLLREKIYRNNSWAQKSCRGTSPEAKRKCSKNMRIYKETADILRAEQRLLPELSKDSVKKSLEKMAGENLEINSIVLSGHDGSGSFYGKAGRTDKRALITALNLAYKDKDHLLDNLNSVYLWGCYTSTRGEVNAWSKLVDSLKVVAGFSGSGPSIGKEASNDSLYDIMTSEDDFYALESAKDVERNLLSIKGINYLLSGIYLKTCNEKEFYLRRFKDPNNRKRTIHEFDENFMSEHYCKKDSTKKAQKELYDEFMQYFDGKLPIPKDTQNGALRRIYNSARANSFCREQVSDKRYLLDPDKVGLLLFFEGVKENFYDSFKAVIDEAAKELEKAPLSEFDFIGYDVNFFEWAAGASRYKLSQALSGEDHKKLKVLVQELQNFPTSKDKFMKLSRRDFNRLNQKLHKASKSSLFLYPGIETESIQKLRKALNIYNYELDTSCMDMLTWHELDHDSSLQAYRRRYYREGCSVEAE